MIFSFRPEADVHPIAKELDPLLRGGGSRKADRDLHGAHVDFANCGGPERPIAPGRLPGAARGAGNQGLSRGCAGGIRRHPTRSGSSKQGSSPRMQHGA